MNTWIQRDITIIAPEDNTELRVRQTFDGDNADAIEVDIVHRGQARQSIILPKEALMEFMAHVTEVLNG